MKEYRFTIKEYLNHVNSSVVYHNAGGCTLLLTEEGSALIYPDLSKVSMNNDCILDFYDEDDRITGIDVLEKDTIALCMRYPTSTFIYK